MYSYLAFFIFVWFYTFGQGKYSTVSNIKRLLRSPDLTGSPSSEITQPARNGRTAEGKGPLAELQGVLDDLLRRVADLEEWKCHVEAKNGKSG